MVKTLRTILRSELSILWIFSILLGIALIFLQIEHRLPLGKGDFVFFSILSLCIALYRPRWAFFLFVSLVPLENIILTSGFLPIQLRPYQFAGVILAVAIAILWILKRLKFKLLRPTWLDWTIFALIPFSFLSLVNSPNRNVSLKNNLILISFIVLYYLVRNFIRVRDDLAKASIFLAGSNIVVLFFGYYQVFAAKFGFASFEVMFGRPNSTFTEPDWLGIFLCFSLALYLSAIYFLKNNTEKYFLYVLVFLNIALLILTLSRSAWIGAAFVIFFFLVFSFFEKEKTKTVFAPRTFAYRLLAIILVSLLSLLIVHFGKLSKFDIFDRARSAATSEQKITVACDSGSNIPQQVSSTDELPRYGCRFISLEEVAKYQSKGKVVTEIFRKDPNVATRSHIYGKSFEILRAHAILGVGFGTITQALGVDERGAGLNESNIFLQVWAGSGLLGLIAFAAVIIYLFVYGLRRISPICMLNKIIGYPVVKDEFEKNVNKFIVLGLVGMAIPNLFNAGLFMGLFWLALGIIVSCIYIE